MQIFSNTSEVPSKSTFLLFFDALCLAVQNKFCIFGVEYSLSTVMSAKNKEIIEALTADVERLMQLHKAAVAEVASLRAKNESQSARIRSLQQQLKDTKVELSNASLREIACGAMGNKAAARTQINRLVREVDKCIAMVSNKI